MDNRFLRWLLILAGMGLLSACVVATTTPSSTLPAPASSTPVAIQVTSLPPTAGVEAGTPTPMALQAAIEDLAGRTGLSASSIQIMSIAPEDWPNPSLGCPKMGVLYAQVIVPGYRLVLNAAGELYEYHTDQGTRAITCAPAIASTQAPQTTAIQTISPVSTYQFGG